MKRFKYLFLIVVLVSQFACITKDKYKETDIYEEYETQNGFTILHLPPVLFKVFLSVSEESKTESVKVFDKIDVIKFMFFEEKKNTIPILELKASMKEKIKTYNYGLLTTIADSDNDISIYIIENKEIIREVLIILISNDEYLSLNLVGKLTKEEVMQIYKSVNMEQIKNSQN